MTMEILNCGVCGSQEFTGKQGDWMHKGRVLATMIVCDGCYAIYEWGRCSGQVFNIKNIKVSLVSSTDISEMSDREIDNFLDRIAEKAVAEVMGS
jgi:hypothetical protein